MGEVRSISGNGIRLQVIVVITFYKGRATSDIINKLVLYNHVAPAGITRPWIADGNRISPWSRNHDRMALIDKLGRKQLMYLGSVGYIISLALVTYAFSTEWLGLHVPVFFFLFIASHAIGQGAVIWVFISEIFPNHLRAQGQAVGSSTHWVLAALIPALIPLLFTKIGPPVVFGFFAFMMVLQLLWVYAIMPETKGVPLEELSKTLIKDE